MKLIKDFFKRENKCEELEKENAELKAKLVERQEVINKTNAYWKKKLRAVSQNSQKKRL
jgi:peptidoglycan hydrolase CwlO-like protein